MTTIIMQKMATRLGYNASYPDWYIVRHLVRERLRSRWFAMMETPTAKAMRDPGKVARWTLAGLSELNVFPDKTSKQQALRAYGATLRNVRNWRYWCGLAVMIVIAAIGGFFLSILLTAVGPKLAFPWLHYAVRLCAMVFIFWILLRSAQRFGAANYLRKRLLHVRVPICMDCGYCLMGHTAGAQKCPECGAGVDERVRTLLNENQCDEN